MSRSNLAACLLTPLVPLVLGGCGSGSAGTSFSMTDSTDTDSGSSDGESESESETESGGMDSLLDVGGDGDGDGCGPQGGNVDFSYIWVANSDQGTMSKLNTLTMSELGRYQVRPDGAGRPSRTSVNLAGDVAVASRDGGLTKVYALHDSCDPEANGQPELQTSSGKEDVLEWGTEECIAWHTPIALTSNRPVAWTSGEVDPDSCEVSDAKVWTAGSMALMSDTARVMLLDGATGDVEVDISVPEIRTDDDFGPYGGAVDADNDFWVVNKRNGAQLAEVSFEDSSYTVYDVPDEIFAYGFTVDSEGRIWIGGFDTGVARFDPSDESWKLNTDVMGFGIQQDFQGRMWTATPPQYEDGAGVLALDKESMEFIEHIDLPGYFTKGVSVDFYGKVWVIDQEKKAFRLDPEELLWNVYDGLDGPYTYSDMTGWGLANVAPAG